MSRLAPTATAVLLCTLISPCAFAEPVQPAPQRPAAATLSVAFGKPTHMQRLYYRRMYDRKPYADAILFYYDNGLYKIISPGEEHYGSYMIDGAFDAPRYTIHYIALPSADWNNTSAYHVVTFDRSGGQGRFQQRAIVPIDGSIPLQHGDYWMADNPLPDPLPVDWQKGNALMPAQPAPPAQPSTDSPPDSTLPAD